MFHPPFNTSDPVALQSSHEASRKANQAQTGIELLSSDVERLLMISEALWMFLKEQHGYSDEELQQKVMEIDMRDGKLDGKVAKGDPTPCSQCSRPLGRRRTRCIYCGTETPLDPFQR